MSKNYLFNFSKNSKVILLRIADEFGVSCMEVESLRTTWFSKQEQEMPVGIFLALAKILKGIHESGRPPNQKKRAVTKLLGITRSFKMGCVPKI